MQFNFKVGARKTAASKTQMITVIGSFWRKIYKTVFLIFLIGVIVLGGYIWNNSLSGGEWSAEKKQQYLDAQNRGIIFKEKDFEKAFSDIEMRKQNKAGDQQPTKDIFKSY